VGYCAQHTLGKRIIDKHPEVKIFGEKHKLKAEVVRMNSYSAHADEPEMIEFLGKLDKKRLKKIFLVHGDIERQEKLKSALEDANFSGVTIPARGDSIQIG